MTSEFLRKSENEERDSSTVGHVEAVAAGNVVVSILSEAPHGTALREGAFHRFPRINSFVVMPSEAGSVLALVAWIGIEDESRWIEKDADRIGFPIPRRKMRLIPLGVLHHTSRLTDSGGPTYTLDRGVFMFPTVGDPVRLPSLAEISAAVPSSREPGSRVLLGKAILAGDAPVFLDPNRLFGRHLAVLGNTGSGKSCTVAHLIRSSASSLGEDIKSFRAIILDLNGEYVDAFDDLPKSIRIARYRVIPKESDSQLRVPAWLWNYQEWLSFTEASPRSQAPQLRRALQVLKSVSAKGGTTQNSANRVAELLTGRRIVGLFKMLAIEAKTIGENLSALDNVRIAASLAHEDATDDECLAFEALVTELSAILNTRRGSGDFAWKMNPRALDVAECDRLTTAFDTILMTFDVESEELTTRTADSPEPFDPMHLLELIPTLAANSGPEVVGWMNPLLDRMRIAFSDERVDTICRYGAGDSLATWLASIIPDGDASQISILDLSLVPPHILHLLLAVIARVTLEAMERHSRLDDNQSAPVLLVVEEAHTAIRRHVGRTEDSEAMPLARLCREAFERIAREGRKFGLSMVISSQRPSELSETVLSQCNTFLIHRIVNDQDQALVRRMVPDSLGPMTDELAILPSQTALLLGWAIDVPTVVRVSDLDERFQPRSADPDFRGTWSGANSDHVKWLDVARSWTSSTRSNEERSLATSDSSTEFPDEEESH